MSTLNRTIILYYIILYYIILYYIILYYIILYYIILYYIILYYIILYRGKFSSSFLVPLFWSAVLTNYAPFHSSGIEHRTSGLDRSVVDSIWKTSTTAHWAAGLTASRQSNKTLHDGLPSVIDPSETCLRVVLRLPLITKYGSFLPFQISTRS
jgi:hypothetical protein